MTQSKAAAGFLVASLMLGGSAVAQTDVSSKGDFSSKGPIDITADQAEVSTTRCVAIWRGSAEAVQDKTRLRADVLTVYSRVKGTGADGRPECGGADRIVADGHVYYVGADQNARGDHAVYSQAKDQIVLTGDVVVVQGQNVARGDRLTISLSNHEATMAANQSGPGKSRRVRAVFYPEKTAKADTPASPEPQTRP